MKISRFLPKVLWLMFGVGVVGCGGGGTSDPQLADPLVEFVNLSPDSGALDFYLNDSPFTKGIGYLGTSTGFESIKYIDDTDGGYDFSIVQSSTGDELERDNASPGKGTSSLVLAFGLLNYGTDDAKRILQTPISVERTAPIGNKARLLIFNALQQPIGTDNVDIDFQTADPNDKLSSSLPQFIKQNLQYGGFSNDASVLLIDSGSKYLQARQSSGGANSSVVVLADGTFNLEPGKIYLAVVSGIVDSVDPATQPKITMIPIATK